MTSLFFCHSHKTDADLDLLVYLNVSLLPDGLNWTGWSKCMFAPLLVYVSSLSGLWFHDAVHLQQN